MRSRVGNAVTAAFFGLVTGVRIADTQTGLRGYPHRMLDWLVDVPGDRFEYELEPVSYTHLDVYKRQSPA